ncbi:AMP-binding protein [Hydrocarboniphaga sp.]|uniref:AMP-binding protein n=1 Tax=Hydrocarboniphaga sp. TaxID=2033016 RepID=UPI003D105A78
MLDNGGSAPAISMLPLQRLYQHERQRPRAIFMTQPFADGHVRDFSWAETMNQSRRLAAHLLAQNWPAGSHIALLGKNSAWWFIADFAIWMAGHVSVPLYHTLTAPSILQIVEHSECVACFVGRLDDDAVVDEGLPPSMYRMRMPDSRGDGGAAWDQIQKHTRPLETQPLRDGDDIATIVYTSGTTGAPKGVMHSFATLALVSSMSVRMFGASASDRLISYLPLAHIADRGFCQLASVQTGCRVFFAFGIDTFVADMRRARPTLFLSVPRLWTKFQQGVNAQLPQAKLQRLLKLPIVSRIVRKKIRRGLGLDAVRVAFSGAAPTPPDLFLWYRALGIELLEVYGMSENFGISHVGRLGRYRPDFIGPGWDGVVARIAADSGELQMKSPGAMRGYYKAPQATAEAFTADGYLKTGDRGELSADGFLKITGRIKEQFKTAKGKYVVPAPIENRLCTAGRIEACCVTGGDALPAPLAMVMLGADEHERCLQDETTRRTTTAWLEQLLAEVNAELERHERLACLVVTPEAWTVANGLVTPTMKVRRNQIDERYRSRMPDWCTQSGAVIWATR